MLMKIVKRLWRFTFIAGSEAGVELWLINMPMILLSQKGRKLCWLWSSNEDIFNKWWDNFLDYQKAKQLEYDQQGLPKFLRPLSFVRDITMVDLSGGGK